MKAISWIDRAMGRRLREALAGFPAVALTGARQVGKTALCRHV
jgi:predicted AAA+ superfamily ATPase